MLPGGGKAAATERLRYLHQTRIPAEECTASGKTADSLGNIENNLRLAQRQWFSSLQHAEQRHARSLPRRSKVTSHSSPPKTTYGKWCRRQLGRRYLLRKIHEHNTTFTDPHIHSRIHLFQKLIQEVLDTIPNISPTAGGKCHGGMKYDTVKTQVVYHLITHHLYASAKKALGEEK